MMPPYFLAFIILLVVIGVVAVSLIMNHQGVNLQSRSSTLLDMLSRKAELLSQRQTLYQQMVALDFDYSVDKVSEDDYAHQRYDLMEQAVDILKELDALKSQLPEVDRVERAVAAYRAGDGRVVAVSKDVGFCPSCGDRVKPSALFCGACGTQLAHNQEVVHAR